MANVRFGSKADIPLRQSISVSGQIYHAALVLAGLINVRRAPLERALAASTAVPGIWPPITINGERFIDGGVRSMLNADLAIGSDIVIAVSCFPLTARDKAVPAFFTAMNAAPLAELDALRGSARPWR